MINEKYSGGVRAALFFACTQPEACQTTAEEAHTCLHLSSIASKLSKLEFLI